MKRVVKRKTFYVCEKCHTEYTGEEMAIQCEKRPIEKRGFRVGNVVKGRELRACSLTSKTYLLCGVVTKVIGPKSSDVEYEKKWLGDKPERVGSHVYLYLVEYRCPHCKDNREDLFYSPELKLVRRR